jgi:hypothetical protein
MERIFEHFHLNLVESEQADWLIHPLTREEWLRGVFAEKLEFLHHAKPFFWVPHTGEAEFVIGTIVRKKRQLQHKGPDEGAGEFEGEEWQGSMVIIDPEHRPGGQKVAFERDRDVGQPNAILSSLVAHLNEGTPRQYTIVVRSLFDADTFRTFARRTGKSSAT